MAISYDKYRKRMKEAHSSFSHMREEIEQDFRFAAGRQWSETDHAKLRYERRPALTFNQILPLLSTVAGSEIANRFQPLLHPRTPEDQPGVEVMNELVRYFRQRSDAEHEESHAFKDCITTGIGCTEVFVTYEDDPNGMISTCRVPPLEVLWDPSAQRVNLSDASYIFRAKWINKNEFLALWPEGEEYIDEDILSGEARFWEMNDSEVHNQRDAWMYQNGVKSYDQRKDRVLVIEHQYVDREEVYSGRSPDGTRRFYTEERLASLAESDAQAQQQNPQFIPQYPTELVETTRKVYKREFRVGRHVLEEGYSPINGFTYKFMTGFEDRDKDTVEWFGLVRVARDPQEWANKFLSQIIHIIGTNPKGSVHYETGAFVDPRKARSEWSRPDAMIEYRPGMLRSRAVEVVDPPTLPQAAYSMMEYAFQAIPQVMGVNPYMAGQVGDLRRTAGSAVQAIQRQGMVVLSPLFDSLRKHRKSTGLAMIDYIRGYIEEPYTVRIAGPFGSEFVQYTKDIGFGKYDVVVEEGVSTPTSQMEVWKTLTEQGLLDKLMQMGYPLPPETIDLVPNLPTSFKQAFKQNIQRMQQQQEQQAQQPQPQ